MIRVLLVDDHEMVRLGMSSYLSVQEDMDVAGEAKDGTEGVEMALALRPDIILMDLLMEEMDGIEATERILEQWPEAKIIILTSFIDDQKVYPAIEAGASGYLLKTSTASDIAEAIRSIHDGKKVFEEEVTEKLSSTENERTAFLHTELTNREMEVLLLIAQGYSNQEIADELYITLKTVKTHVSNILSKLEVEDRTQAAIYAYKHSLVE
ncbi:response regulator [Atopococcus tabaci]|uniref:response regulator n=1 Tax=Atopococcus tabaci TaxID=269774 RepID=UPI000420AA59|nr:response regulator transcription factor [Atopococcus tabaci]